MSQKAWYNMNNGVRLCTQLLYILQFDRLKM